MSTTYILEKNGWRGFLVEPNINLIDSLRRNRSQPILSAAVSDKNSIEVLCTSQSMEMSTLGTLCLDQASSLQSALAQTGDTLIYQSIAVVSMNNLVDHFKVIHGEYPDFIKLDVEGNEHKIVASLLASPCRPLFIEIENNTRSSENAKLLNDNGYTCSIVQEGFVEFWTQQPLTQIQMDLIRKSF